MIQPNYTYAAELIRVIDGDTKVWAEGAGIELGNHLLATHHAVPWAGK